MLLSDLLHLPVRCEGKRVGFVLDARFVLPRPDVSPGAGPALLLGFIVGPHRSFSFLGYERNDVGAPAVIAATLRRRERGCFLLDAADVLAQDADGLDVRPGFTRWDPTLPAQGPRR